MSDYAGFEKVEPHGKKLTTSNHLITTTEGDIVLYNGNQIVIYYDIPHIFYFVVIGCSFWINPGVMTRP